VAAYFFDSSALIKRYVNEPGSPWVAAVTAPIAGAHVYVAAVTGVEVVATFARKLRGRLVSPGDVAAAVSRFRHDFENEYRVVAVTDAVIIRSMATAEAYALRGYDAVQLGAALELNGRRLALGAAPLMFVTADAELLAAAGAEGLPADDPNNHRAGSG
jgi:hypothetical protein